MPLLLLTVFVRYEQNALYVCVNIPPISHADTNVCLEDKKRSDPVRYVWLTRWVTWPATLLCTLNDRSLCVIATFANHQSTEWQASRSVIKGSDGLRASLRHALGGGYCTQKVPCKQITSMFWFLECKCIAYWAQPLLCFSRAEGYWQNPGWKQRPQRVLVRTKEILETTEYSYTLKNFTVN